MHVLVVAVCVLVTALHVVVPHIHHFRARTTTYRDPSLFHNRHKGCICSSSSGGGASKGSFWWQRSSLESNTPVCDGRAAQPHPTSTTSAATAAAAAAAATIACWDGSKGRDGRPSSHGRPGG